VNRSTRLAARLWWALLPYAGWFAYSDEPDAPRPPLHAYPLAWLWRLINWIGVEPFKPFELPVCDCDYCRGVPGARFEP
jgi:hypothetical protein